VSLDGFVGLRRGLEHSFQFSVALAHIIEGTRYQAYIKDGRVAFCDRIPKLKPTMSVIERLEIGAIHARSKRQKNRGEKTNCG
jgi:hypothetical protein